MWWWCVWGGDQCKPWSMEFLFYLSRPLCYSDSCYCKPSCHHCLHQWHHLPPSSIHAEKGNEVLSFPGRCRVMPVTIGWMKIAPLCNAFPSPWCATTTAALESMHLAAGWAAWCGGSDVLFTVHLSWLCEVVWESGHWQLLHTWMLPF